MAGVGPPPREPTQRRRRNKEQRVVLGEAPDEYPPLTWEGVTAETERWYRDWATSPQASRFTTTDWMRLNAIAPLVDAYIISITEGKPNLELMREIRLNEAALGATAADRQRLRWDLELPNNGQPPTPIRRGLRPRLRVIDDQGKGKVAGG